MTSDDPAARIDRKLAWLAFVGQTASTAAAAAKLAWGSAASYSPGWPWALLAVLGAISLGCLVEVLREGSCRLSTTLFVIASLGVLFSHLWIWHPERALAMPAFDNTAAVGIGLAFLVLPTAGAMADAAVTQLLYLAILPRALGATWSWWIVATTVLAAMVCWVARRVIDESVARMRESHQLAVEAGTLEDQTTLRSRALSSWLDIVHREIIGTLLPASRDQGSDRDLVRTRAGAALSALAAFQLPESEESFSRFATRVSESLGLEVFVEAQGDWNDAGPQRALRSSVTEALSNVERHSGTRSAWVTAEFSPKAWRVRVVDRGTGFEPEAQTASRSHGLRISLIQPWQAAGGTATVVSTVGEGTSVELAWEDKGFLPASWSPRSVRWLATIVVASLTAHLLMGWLAGGYHSPALLAAGQAAIVLVTLLAFISPRYDLAGLGVLTCAQVALATNIAPSQDADLRTWFAGAMTGAVGVMAFRGRWRTSLAAVLLSWVAASWIMAGGTWDASILGRLLGSYIGPLLGLVFAYVGEILRRVDRAHHEQLSRQAAVRRHAAEVRAGLERWDTENSLLIAFVAPMLTTLAQAEPVEPETAAECKALEACCRDYLRSPGFMDRQLLSDALAARRRGCAILFDVSSASSEATLSTLRRTAHEALSFASTASLNVTYIEGGPTTLVVRSDVESLPCIARRLTSSLQSLAPDAHKVTILDGTLLMELRP